MTAPERPLHLAVDRSTVDLTADDRVLARGLAAAGVPVVPTIWGERLAAGRRILIRSTWDYVAKLPRAGEWRVQSRRSMSGLEGSDRTAPAVVVASAPAAAA